MKLPSFISAIFRTAKKGVDSVISKVSPIIIRDLTPILASASEELWVVAFPLAIQIVGQVAKSGIKGYEAHSVAVKQLEAAIAATGKIVITGVVKLHLGQIILAAYAHSPEILAILAAAGVLA